MLKIRRIKPQWQKIAIALAYIIGITFSIWNYDIIIGYDLTNAKSILAAQIPSLDFSDSRGDPWSPADNINHPPNDADLKPVLALDMHPGSGEGYLEINGVQIKNHTNLTPSAKTIAAAPAIKAAGKGPQVLIVHTHASEAFARTDSDWYNPSDPSRTQDMNFTVMKVGEEMAKTLEGMGIKTLQDRSVHDYPAYNGSYKSSLASVENYLKKYPSIKVVIDIHRDSMQRDDGTRLKNIIEIDGEKIAQVMIVTGTDAMGLAHPNWQQNLAFAIKWQQQMNADTPRITRCIDLREERFNTHTTTGTLLLEVGSTQTTLDEALRGGRLAAQSLGKLLLE
ncbi:MAG: stage II sporulation protein P [Oscillospiraceae bacterium]|nr:stage II sporulation protein P [Oscillospiraceae bacterium]